MNSKCEIELIGKYTEEFDGRSFWSRTLSIAGMKIVVRWVAEGELHKSWKDFRDHSDRIFDTLVARTQS